ncbi:undecaprenyl-phosphate galactose phosphotransferase [Faecalicoccus acidiformans]|uniref:Undecaprenyl-phosphate galactose phosphotransferase n=1 Tax=Faecalicoccus acidiformans TaxID=915173 RepID=A0A7W8FVU5_9FIRM|nr:sugar transferase [Faecalicoccus acidiformans]MBB5183969.1 undecaprenyl-phosphate galactose phosphotransferase [Faecalicoccus acidiformans]
MKRIALVNFIVDILLIILLFAIFQFNLNYHWRLVVLFSFVQLMCGRYRDNVLLIWEEIKVILISHAWFFIISILFFRITQWQEIFYLLLITLLSAFFCLLFSRYSHIWFRSYFKKNVLIIGMGHTAEKLSGTIKNNRFSLMDVRAFINCNNSSLLPHAYQQVKVVEDYRIFPLDEIEKVIQKEKITTVIIAVPQLISSDIEILLKLLNDKVNEIKVLPRTETLVTFDSRIDDFDGLLMISTAQSKITFTSRFFKRILDIIGGIVGFILLIPLYFFVRRKNHKEGDYGPVMFRQIRIGKDGKEFTIYKFRTMIENAEEKLEVLMRTDPAIREEYLTNKKLVNDPRITKAGKFLRRTSLDEFPQFINVIKGEMSLIGPRPYLPREKEDMGDFYHTIIQMKPGLTGMWQTHGRSDTDFVTRLSLDDYYFRNYSLWLDMTILIRTIKTILGGKDANAR